MLRESDVLPPHPDPLPRERRRGGKRYGASYEVVASQPKQFPTQKNQNFNRTLTQPSRACVELTPAWEETPSLYNMISF